LGLLHVLNSRLPLMLAFQREAVLIRGNARHT
jgi:hypothetical protein